jgi:hypothetical protein
MRVGVVVGLAENFTAAFDDRVRAQHQYSVGAPRYRERLFFGHPERELRRRFAGVAFFLDAAFAKLELDSGGREQCSAPRRGRGENQSGSGHRCKSLSKKSVGKRLQERRGRCKRAAERRAVGRTMPLCLDWR